MRETKFFFMAAVKKMDRKERGNKTLPNICFEEDRHERKGKQNSPH
jgi:hypothetical protein